MKKKFPMSRTWPSIKAIVNELHALQVQTFCQCALGDVVACRTVASQRRRLGPGRNVE